MFKVLYKKILWVQYKDRLINNIDWNILRNDEIYEILTKLYYYDKNAQKKILLILEKLDLNNPTQLAFLSYVYALNHKWKKALSTMEKIIYLEKWQNVDSFIDYWHFLRKIKKYQDLSVNLLLNLELYISIYTDIYDKWWKISIIKILNDN